MNTRGEERWSVALREHAARLAFPGWTPGPGDWTSLYTSFDGGGAPVTEVAVYRGHDRIHYRRYMNDDLTGFWTRLVNELAE